MVVKEWMTREWIESLPKEINSNGCWLLINGVTGNHGYTVYSIEGEAYLLHRLAKFIFEPDSKLDWFIETRHSIGCERRCFNPSHLQFGSRSENARDMLLAGNHNNARKDCCPKCGGPYKTSNIVSGRDKGTSQRYCSRCNNAARNIRRAKARSSKKC